MAIFNTILNRYDRPERLGTAAVDFATIGLLSAAGAFMTHNNLPPDGIAPVLTGVSASATFLSGAMAVKEFINKEHPGIKQALLGVLLDAASVVTLLATIL